MAKERTPEPILTWGDARTPAGGIDVLVTGDYCPRDRFEEKVEAGEPILGPGVRALLAEADVTVVNLETPLVKPEERTPTGYMAAGPGIARHMKRLGIDVAGLANNHIRDQDDRGVLSTIEALDAAGVASVGAGRDLEEAERMLVHQVCDFKLGVWALAEKEFNLATTTRPGSSWFRPVESALRVPELREQVDFLLLYVHAGHEYMTVPSPRIREAYRRFIDAGADAVVAHHPHVVQGLEAYGGGWIFYSLGNFLFDPPRFSYDGGRNTDWGLMVRLRISRHGVSGFEVFATLSPPEYCVRLMNAEEREATLCLLQRYNAALMDEDTLRTAFERYVHRRFVDTYWPIMRALPERLADPEDGTYRRLWQNYFGCPTHQDLLETAMRMLREGTIDLDESDAPEVIV